MSENDYIAEYVKEKRPEIIQTTDFLFWKIGRTLGDFVDVATKAFTDFLKGGGNVEEMLTGEETEEGEEDGSTECTM